MTSVKLFEIADIIMGQSPKSSAYNSSGYGLPFMQGKTTFGRIFPYYDTWTTEWNKEANPTDILFTVRAPVGDVNICREKTAIGRGLASIRAKRVNYKYLYYLLESNKRYFSSVSTGSVFDSINKDKLENTEFIIHNQVEQQHIVDTIGSIDDLIEKYEEIIHKIDNYSLLLVTLNMKNTKTIKLKDIIEISSGKAIKSSNGDYHVIGANGEIGLTTNYNNEGKILVTGRVGTIGTFTRYNEKCWCSDNTLIIKSNYLNYLNYYLNNNFDCQAYNRGSTQPLITQSDILQLEIELPQSINQLEIELDLYFEEISKYKNRIKELNNLKQLYLNKFFN